jgi:hypothetical protein
VIEDPYGKDSATTLPIQMADVIAYFLMQRTSPNRYIQSQRAQNYLERRDFTAAISSDQNDVTLDPEFVGGGTLEVTESYLDMKRILSC